MARKAKMTHVDERGAARMVDVGAKPATARRALAGGRIRMSSEAANALKNNTLSKGDALAAARIAGIQAAKRTSEWIPLCHPLVLSHANVDIEVDAGAGLVTIRTEVRTTGPTGVEMEALTAVAGAALTLYDMLKAVDRSMVIEEIALLEKEGGRSGHFVRQNAPRGQAERRRPGRSRR